MLPMGFFMSKQVVPLSPLKIKNAKPQTKPYTLFDGGGLHVLVQPTGTKIFRLKINIDGKDRRLTLGTVGDINLAQARENARLIKQKVSGGIDPTVTPESTTFKTVSERFIQWKSSVALRAPATIRKYKECLSNDLIPKFGQSDIKNIHIKEVVEFLEVVSKRSPSLAGKNKELVGMIVRFAIQRGLRPPYTQLDLSGIVPRRPATEKRMIDPQQFPLANIQRCRSPVMRQAIKLQFLCFLRASETMGGKWVEVDFNKAEWVIPGERMKKRRTHVVPLSAQSIEVLRYLKKLTGGTEFLFPSLHKPGSMCRDSLSKIFRNLNLGLHPHACRTLASTWLRNAGHPPHIVEAQLSHVEKNAIAAAYQHSPWLMYMEERRPMMQKWADVLLPEG